MLLTSSRSLSDTIAVDLRILPGSNLVARDLKLREALASDIGICVDNKPPRRSIYDNGPRGNILHSRIDEDPVGVWMR